MRNLIFIEKSTARTCTKGIDGMYGILTSDMAACFDCSLTFSDTINLRGPRSTDHSFFSLIIVKSHVKIMSNDKHWKVHLVILSVF